MKAALPARPKVLQILYSGLGGHYAVATTLIRAGGDDDPWNHHLLFFGIEPVASGYAEDCDRAGIAYSYVGSTPGRPFLAWPALAREVRRIAPDVILLHSIKAILAIRKAAGTTPVIAVEHQSNALKTKAEWGSSLSAQWLADRVITLSRDYRDGLRGKLGPLFRAARTVIVPTGIDLHFPPRKSPPLGTSGPVRIGMAARVTPNKGQEVLVEAAALLRRTHPELDLQFTLAGDGVCLPAVRAAVSRLDVAEFVELPGHIPAEALPQWFGGIDIYAHVSDGETLSTSLLQAMAAGVPIVASDVPGIADLLGPPADGSDEALARLVPARDPAAFAEAIADICADRQAALATAGHALQRVGQYHSLEAMRAGYRNTIKDICHAR